MSLNNFYFLVFFIILLGVLFLVQKIGKENHKVQRIQLLVLLIFSYLFISIADIRFGICIAVVTAVAYMSGRLLEMKNYNKLILVGGVILCILILGYFKYSNFFVNSFSKFLGRDHITLNIILPIGISFYVFTALSYIYDIYKNKYPVQKNLLNFALFIGFFPKVTAGPIVRGIDFFPQILSYPGLKSENFKTGIQIFVFGLFKKMVLADHLNVFVNDVFFAPSAYSSATVLLAVISYSMQIYFDFSGYSDMAIGISKILGFHFKQNFNLPYIAENPSEFWKRWHISLSSWFRDYLYIPLGGNRKGHIRTYLNQLIVMLVSGLWHGAGWTFIVWGLLHGVVSVIHVAYSDRFVRRNGLIYRFAKVIIMFSTVTLLWVIFRSSDLINAFEVYRSLFSVHKGISQPYTWSFFSLICLVNSSLYSIFKSKGNKVNGYYPLLDLNKFWHLVVFFTFIGLTIILGYYGNNVFIYGNF